MARLKAVQLLVNAGLPDDLKDYSRPLDAGSIGRLMTQVALRHPDKYGQIVKHISDIGRQASYRQGETLTLKDMEPVLDRDGALKLMDAEIAQAKKLAKNDPEFKQQREGIWRKYSDMLEKQTSVEALRQGNALADSVVSGARGKPAQLKAMITTPGLYDGPDGSPVPMFIRHSFGEGLRPAEYLAGTYGARLSTLSTKRATAKGGFYSKQLAQAASTQPVTMKDCGAGNGIDLPVDDQSLKNRVLAVDAGGIKAGTIIDRLAIAQLKKAHVSHAIVRSALTCQAPEGICAKCAGAGAEGRLPHVGESVGITAAQALGEPITQSALNVKHVGGASSSKREYSGFDVINRFSQSPEVFEDKAVVAEKDGKVEQIDKAPQGGHFVTAAGIRHYVPAGYPVLAKVGDKVEAGDQLSEGLIDPSDIVRLRGIGEGRRYYAERFKKLLDDSGMPADLRNTELIARSVINHVVVNNPDGIDGHLVDDIIPYEQALNQADSPIDVKAHKPSDAVGEILHQPALHYSVGTRITPRVAAHMESRGIDRIHTSRTAPDFEPEMVRLQSATENQDDWLAQQHTSHLRKNLSESAMRGNDTNTRANVHFVPRLAIGTDFGKDVGTTGRF